MAHVTTPNEAEAAVTPLADRLSAAGYGEIAAWIVDCARAVPYLVDEGLECLEAEIARLEKATAHARAICALADGTVSYLREIMQERD